LVHTEEDLVHLLFHQYQVSLILQFYAKWHIAEFDLGYDHLKLLK